MRGPGAERTSNIAAGSSLVLRVKIGIDSLRRRAKLILGSRSTSLACLEYEGGREELSRICPEGAVDLNEGGGPEGTKEAASAANDLLSA